jgi:hypothetical protein
MKTRTFILTIGAAFALVAPAAQAASTRSASNAQAAAGSMVTNFWRSPSGNIACRYYPTLAVVTCQTDNDRYAVAVARYGSKAFPTFYRWIPSYAPELAYGAKWTAPGLVCLSTTVAMGCGTSAGHGFTISRNTVDRW